jgi:FemAB-related protein (PEP-CTERM system-associated)
MNREITIRPYEKMDQQVWDQYVEEHPKGTMFHLTRWKKVIEKTFGHKSHYLIAVQSTFSPPSFQASQLPGLPASQLKVIGILPLFQIKSFLFGHHLISVPFAELGGVLADDKDVERMLLDRAIEMTEEMKCDYLELRNREQIENLPAKSLYYNFRREIYSDPDQNMQAIPRKARRMIRQGIKFGLYSEFGIHLLHDFYEILAKSYHQLGTPIFSKRFFRTFLDEFGTDAQILVVYDKKGTPVAGVLSFFFKDQILPYYAGSLFEYRKLALNDFMYWALMSYGCEKGCKIFDFGRSKIDTGSYHFKRHWGFKPVPLSYQYYLNRINEFPNLSPANPKYQKKIELWRKMPFKVTKILGPSIAKYLA